MCNSYKKLYETYLNLNSNELWFPLGNNYPKQQLNTSLAHGLITPEGYHTKQKELLEVLGEFKDYSIQ